MRQVRAAAITAVLAVAVVAAWTPVRAASPPVVLHDVLASTDPYGATTLPNADPSLAEQPNTEVEPAIAVNPGDAKNVVTGFQVTRVDAGGDRDNGFATSFDGGVTWVTGNLPALTKGAPHCPNAALAGCAFDRGSDASVAFGRDPTGHAYGGFFVYYNSLVFDDTSQNALPSGMAINVSSDGGKTWTDATILQSDNLAGLNDKNWVIVDNGTGLGHHPGRVYIFWDKVLASLAYAYCDPDVVASVVTGAGCDKAANWTSVHNTSWYTMNPNNGIGTFPVVLKDGSVGVLYNQGIATSCLPSDQSCTVQSGTSLVFELIAGAGAVAWPLPLAAPQAAVEIAKYESSGVVRQRAGTLPQLAVDPSSNELYVVWEDHRFRTDNGATPGPTNNSSRNDPLISWSKPDPITGFPGTTWSAPARIDAAAPTGDLVNRYNPTVAVGGDGIVRVAYRQRYEGAPFSASTGLGTPIDTYYQESSDAAGTWSAPLKVDTTQGTTDPSFGAFSRFASGGGLFEGDYEQIAAAGPGESYVTRDEAWNPSPDTLTSCNTGFTTPRTCQNQQTFVALIGPQQPPTDTPDSRFVPLLLLAGAAGTGATVWRRRRARETAALV